jgi:hypothetical protein
MELSSCTAVLLLASGRALLVSIKKSERAGVESRRRRPILKVLLYVLASIHFTYARIAAPLGPKSIAEPQL